MWRPVCALRRRTAAKRRCFAPVRGAPCGCTKGIAPSSADGGEACGEGPVVRDGTCGWGFVARRGLWWGAGPLVGVGPGGSGPGGSSMQPGCCRWKIALASPGPLERQSV